MNEGILEDDDEIFEPTSIEEDDSDEPIQDLNDKEDSEIENAIHEAYLTPPPSEEDDDSPCAFHVQYPLGNPDTEEEQSSNNKPDNEIRESFNRACEERFADFNIEKITSPYHGAFTAGRRFKDPKPSKTLSVILYESNSKKLNEPTSSPTNI